MRARTSILLPVLVAALAAPAQARPTVSVSPSTVVRGNLVTFTGAHWAAYVTVQLLIGPPRSEASPISSARTNGSGRFRKTLRISSRARPGSYVVLACRRSCRVKASARLTIVRSTVGRGAAAPRALENKIVKVGVPAKVRAGKEFLLELDLQLDARLHQPPRDYLKAAMFRTRGSGRCPRTVPLVNRSVADKPLKGWSQVLTYDYSQSPSERIGVMGHDTLKRRGTYRYCAYIYVDRYIYRPGDTILLPTHVTKKRASKLVRAV